MKAKFEAVINVCYAHGRSLTNKALVSFQLLPCNLTVHLSVYMLLICSYIVRPLVGVHLDKPTSLCPTVYLYLIEVCRKLDVK